MSDEKKQPVIPTTPPYQGVDEEGVATTESIPQEPKKDKKSFFKKPCRDCEKHKKESEEYKNNWQRALADYQNLQRETSERRGEWARMSEQQILEDFIPVYDNFKKAFAIADNADAGGAADNADKKWQSWKQGIRYIMKQFWEVLKAHNAEEIKTVGEKFDRNFMRRPARPLNQSRPAARFRVKWSRG